MPVTKNCAYGDVRATNMNFDQAVARMEAALKDEGFGVLCQIDIQGKLKEKLGIEFPKYVILGACNPPLAHHALQQDTNLGLLLPCNAVVYERGGQVYVGTIDAVRMLSITERPELENVAREANQKLGRALDSAAPQSTFA
jgi:uncharacterized protein (DUF302 family)